MDVIFDEAKRQKTLRDRGLDFADAGKVLMDQSIHRRMIGSTIPNRDSRLLG